MSDRCEPPPELRGVDGWHEIERPTGVRLIAEWQPQPERRCKGRWSTHAGLIDADSAAGMFGWRYLSPVASAAEVEALSAERDALAADKRAAQTFQTHNAQMVRERDAELATLRARVAELEKVVALYQAEVGAFTGRGTTLARLMEIDGLARASLSPATEATPE